MILSFLLWIQIFKDQCGSVPSISVAVLDLADALNDRQQQEFRAQASKSSIIKVRKSLKQFFLKPKKRPKFFEGFLI